MSSFEKLEDQIKRTLNGFGGKVSLMVEAGGKRIGFNANHPMQSASVIKLPILVEAYRQMDQGLLKGAARVEINPEDFVEGSGVLFHMDSIRRLSLHDLLTLMIIVSDNTASNLAIKTVGQEAVNGLFQELGCRESHLGRYFMDFEAAARGLDNITSAADMVTVLKAADSGGFLSEDSRKRVLHTLKQQQLKNNLHGRIDEDHEISIASKSGGLPGVVNDAGIFELRGEKVYAAVLLGDLTDNHTGQELIAEIGWWISEYLMETVKSR